MTQNKKYVLRKIGKHVCSVAMTISSVAVIASTTVSADEVVTPSEPNVTTVTEAKVDKVSKQETKTNSAESVKAKLSSDSTATDNNGVYHQILKGKSLLDEASSETVQRKPMDLIAIVDFSSSLQVKRTEALTQLKTLIEKNLTDDDKSCFKDISIIKKHLMQLMVLN